jgi:hypothetical protein
MGSAAWIRGVVWCGNTQDLLLLRKTACPSRKNAPSPPPPPPGPRGGDGRSPDQAHLGDVRVVRCCSSLIPASALAARACEWTKGRQSHAPSNCPASSIRKKSRWSVYGVSDLQGS